MSFQVRPPALSILFCDRILCDSSVCTIAAVFDKFLFHKLLIKLTAIISHNIIVKKSKLGKRNHRCGSIFKINSFSAIPTTTTDSFSSIGMSDCAFQMAPPILTRPSCFGETKEIVFPLKQFLNSLLKCLPRIQVFY